MLLGNESILRATSSACWPLDTQRTVSAMNRKTNQTNEINKTKQTVEHSQPEFSKQETENQILFKIPRGKIHSKVVLKSFHL